MADTAPAQPDTSVREFTIASEIEVRNEGLREVGLRIVPWNVVVDTPNGPEMFERGAFDDHEPSNVRLRMDHQDPPTGKGFRITQPEDAAYAEFRVAKTSRGDEQLQLIREGVHDGASVGFQEVPGGTTTRKIDGRHVRVHKRVRLREVSTTWRPAYEQSAVMYVRSEETGDAPMAEQAAPDGAVQDSVFAAQMAAIEAMRAQMTTTNEKLLDRIDKLEERSRQDFVVPNGGVSNDQANAPHKGDWVQAVVRLLTGERVSDRELEQRALANLITTDNAGVVPDAFSQELIGVIDAQRPFMATTRTMATPTSGMGLILPKIVTRPSVATQATEKAELSSTATSITTATYDAETLGGAGDISLQLLKRSSPEFLGLYLELLAEAMSLAAEDRAVDVLLAASPTAGGVIAPANLSLGAAWTNSNNSRLRPDTIWMSSAAVAAFIDAKATTTNTPLYSTLQPNITAGGGLGGTISGLRPVHVPTLDNETVKVIVGPSRGFAWAEDGSYTLQVDVPSKAGRDVAMVSIFWFAPLYPSAFTTYTLV
jgi:HK97 family phage major capsid protein/HK97 family phage prohead protease